MKEDRGKVRPDFDVRWYNGIVGGAGVPGSVIYHVGTPFTVRGYEHAIAATLLEMFEREPDRIGVERRLMELGLSPFGARAEAGLYEEDLCHMLAGVLCDRALLALRSAVGEPVVRAAEEAEINLLLSRGVESWTRDM